MQRFVSQELSLALDGRLACQVCESEEILGVDSNTTAIRLSLIKRIGDTLVVVVQETAVLHELNGASFDHTTTLRVLVHHSDL